MTREKETSIAEKIAVMTAYANGESIQARTRKYLDNWANCLLPKWNWNDFDYRITPKPSYKPFSDKEEFIQFLKTHSGMPYVLLNGGYKIVSQIYNEGIIIAETGYAYQELIKKNIKFLDGTVCGIPV